MILSCIQVDELEGTKGLAQHHMYWPVGILKSFSVACADVFGEMGLTCRVPHTARAA